MIKYPKIYLPLDFIGLLKANVPEKSENWRKIIEYVWGHPTLFYIVKNCFQGLDQKKTVDYIITTLGWKNFRDRLASIFLYHFQHGIYPPQADLFWVNDIIKLNSIFETYTAPGNSRGFMLGFYLKYIKILIEKNEMIINPDDMKLNSDILNLLKLMNRKVDRIDWLMIVLWHMVSFIGLENVKKELSTKSLDYKKFLQKLDKPDRDLFLHNCLIYAQAINEPEVFTSILK